MSAVSVLLDPQDEAFGDQLASALAREGKEARLISGDAADLFSGKQGGVSASIVVWSEAALRLARLHVQAREALENGALIPVSVDGAPAPAGFETLPPIDLAGWSGEDDDPRWRFVLEALAIASEYAPPAVDGAEPETPTPAETPDLSTSTALAPVNLTEPFSPATLPPVIADGEMRAIPTITQLQALQPLPRRRKKARPAAAPKPTRFDPGAVAVAGVMLLCLVTGAAIILGPSLLTPSSERAAPTPAPPEALTPGDAGARTTPGPSLIFDAPEKYAAEETAGDEDAMLYEPYTDNIEGIGEGDISYPEDGAPVFVDPYETDTRADDLHLAMLGPAIPGDALPPALKSAPAMPDGPRRAPSIKPAPVKSGATTPETVGGLLAGMASANNPNTDVIRDCAQCPDMIAISPAAYSMGPGAGERKRPNEGPARRMELTRAYAIAAREVTFAEWDACVSDGGCNGHEAEDFGWGRGEQPVVGVSYEDALRYAAWLSAKTGAAYRLPSEAEWEFAARAGSAAAFSFGDELSPSAANYDARYVYRGKKGRWVGRPTPASRYPANAFGLFDMHGNVWEWTADCWRNSLAGLPSNGARRGGACATRTLKGGAFNTGGWRLRSAHRIGKPAGAREMEIGFRVVREL